MTLKEAIIIISKQKLNAQRVNCNKAPKYPVCIREMMDARNTLTKAKVELNGNAYEDENGKVVATIHYKHSQRETRLCHNVLGATLKFADGKEVRI